MKLKTLFGLGLVGAALYAHKRNGGELSIDSIKSNLGKLMNGTKRTAKDAADAASELGTKAANRARDAARDLH